MDQLDALRASASWRDLAGERRSRCGSMPAASSARSRLSTDGSSSRGELAACRAARPRLRRADALAVVLEVGLGALRQLEVLVALALDVRQRAASSVAARRAAGGARRPDVGGPPPSDDLASASVLGHVRILTPGRRRPPRRRRPPPRLAGAVGGGAVAVRRARLLGRGLLVDLLGDLVEGRLQGVGLALISSASSDSSDVAHGLDRVLDLRLGGRIDLVAQLLELLLGLVGGVLGDVAGLGQLALPCGPRRRATRRP